MNASSPINVPHVDPDMAPARVAEMAERIAVPNFDWVGQPIGAIVDGLSGHAHDHEKADRDPAP